MGILLSDQRLRAMYPGGRGDRMARRFARLWAGVFAQGLAPRRWVTLEVRGRRSGRTVRFPWAWPIGRGIGTSFPCSASGATGCATSGLRTARLPSGAEVPSRASWWRCLQARGRPSSSAIWRRSPGARPHIPVDRRAAVAEFEAVSSRTPVFLVVPVPRSHGAVPKPTDVQPRTEGL
jgi:hypothetical protein